jgi:hypothetical protein
MIESVQPRTGMIRDGQSYRLKAKSLQAPSRFIRRT